MKPQTAGDVSCIFGKTLANVSDFYFAIFASPSKTQTCAISPSQNRSQTVGQPKIVALHMNESLDIYSIYY